MQKKIDKIVKELSLRYRIPVKDVEDAIKSQFLFARRTIEEATKDEVDTFKVVKLLSFGKFIPNKPMIGHMIRTKKEKKDNADRSD